ncbi:Golgi resident protein GCP60 [Dermatophagoides farinae]|uniref:Golgi resident protein GCP60 n=1 Tax=Dermatophagoides farinae TaxID=6954 RepID=A0A922HZH1_DERFA|nr:Golgi resident protein GCP60 [Dermatophagoides farinae]
MVNSNINNNNNNNNDNDDHGTKNDNQTNSSKMMTNGNIDNKNDCFMDSSKTTSLSSSSLSDQKVVDNKNITIEWPYDEKDLYKISLNFFKENEGKAFHPSYDQRNMLVALTLQEKHGKFNQEKAIPLGALDFVGHDRRNAWISLNTMPANEARQQFFELLDKLCPFFRSYLIAVRCDMEEKERKQKELEELKLRKLEELEKCRAEEEARAKRLVIKELLNRQTINQFTTYAQQQYPDSIELQEQLVKQLQEQHFQQYIEQMTMDQQGQSNNNHYLPSCNVDTSDVNNGNLLQCENTGTNVADNIGKLSSNGDNNIDEIHSSSSMQNEIDQDAEEDEESDDDDESILSRQVSNASMWTRKDLVAFKDSVQAEGGHGIIKVGHGEIATIRVPTHDDGSCIFWEFATDNYDIGFGLFFEWNSSPDSQVSVYFSESEDDEEDEQEPSTTGHDIEKGTNRVLNSRPSSCRPGVDHPPISAIIPIYRRDSHEEVFAGNHVYPGKGVYLLKFDNSYSLWRSKTLYYRVYYTKEP